MQNNKTCFCCLQKKSKCVLTCNYLLCETCIQTFDKIEKIVEYRYRIDNCFFYNSKSIRVSLKFFTTKFRVLNIDEKNVRDLISLKFLSFFQNAIESTCKLQKFFDLTFETSSDKILLN